MRKLLLNLRAEDIVASAAWPSHSPAKNGIFEPFIYKNDHFAKTGSGQTWGKLKKRCRFSHRELRRAGHGRLALLVPRAERIAASGVHPGAGRSFRPLFRGKTRRFWWFH